MASRCSLVWETHERLRINIVKYDKRAQENPQLQLLLCGEGFFESLYIINISIRLFCNVRLEELHRFRAVSSKRWLLALMSCFHLSAWQTNKSSSVWLWPANIYYIYPSSLVSGTYYSLKPLTETASQSLNKQALSVQRVNRRQSTQTWRGYNLHHFQESEEMLLRVPLQAAVYPRPPHLSTNPLFVEKKAAFEFEYAYAMSKHVLLSRVPLHSCQQPELKTGKTSFPKSLSGVKV